MTFAENYEQGMKMLVKLSKNPNATLHSDMEEKGKGKRRKRPVKHFDNSDKENYSKKERNEQSMLPPFPQLTNANKSSQSSQPLLDEIMNQSLVNQASSSSYVQKPIFVAREKNVFRETLKSKDYKVHKGIKPVKESSVEIHMSKNITNTSEGICSSQEVFLSAAKCEKCSKNQQKCAYGSNGEVTLKTLADAICYLNGKLKTSSYIY